jgi:orotidine-5'-phosphate decarboxylase
MNPTQTAGTIERTPRPAARAVPIVALDVPTTESALMIVSHLGELCRFYKIAGELFTAAGPATVQALRDHGCDVFLDLKFHDIPNTVRGAARSAARIGARIISVHATGGRAMMEAAVEGAQQGAGSTGTPPEVFAVTVLTSLDAQTTAEAWGRPAVNVREEVHRLADLARQSGVTGIVCGGHEAAEIRQAYGDTLKLLIPGVRLAGTAANDQVRVVTPAEAVEAGASYIVVGRTVTAADAVREAMRRVITEIG